MEFGRKLLEKEIRKFDLNPKTVLAPEALRSVAGEFGAEQGDALFAVIGYGKVTPRSRSGQARPAGAAARAEERNRHRIGCPPRAQTKRGPD